MRTYSKITPEGARDLLFEECRARREVQAKLSQVFTLRGYRAVITPGLEYFDVFNLPGAAIPQQEMYKCTDNHGRLVVFRPDSTLPIARMAASRLQGWERPLRFFYSQTIYRNRPDLSGRSDESAQMGILFTGAGGPADLRPSPQRWRPFPSACRTSGRLATPGSSRLWRTSCPPRERRPAGHHRIENYAPSRAAGPPGGTCPQPVPWPSCPGCSAGGGPGRRRGWFQDGETWEIQS
ncbi:MAG: ATP phosphoribosyltransferase regulatory subunit [Acutalibacter sp.]